MAKTKVCFACGETKARSEFYAHPEMGDGLLGKCKECTKKHVRENYSKNRDYYLAYDKQRNSLKHRVAMREKYQKSERGREVANAAKRKWANNNPVERAASWMVNNAVRDGKLIKGCCEVCGSTTRIHGHHEDYSKPLTVMWLCPLHHRMIHST